MYGQSRGFYILPVFTLFIPQQLVSFKGDWKKCWYVYFLLLNKPFTAEKLEMRVQKWRNGRNTSSLSISASEKKILLFYLERNAKALLQVYRGKMLAKKDDPMAVCLV